MNTIRRNSVSNTDENRENAIRINTTEEKFCCSYLSNSRIMLCTVFSQVVVAGIWEYRWKLYTSTIRMRVLSVFSSCVSPTTYGSHEATIHQRCIIHMNENTLDVFDYSVFDIYIHRKRVNAILGRKESEKYHGKTCGKW